MLFNFKLVHSVQNLMKLKPVNLNCCLMFPADPEKRGWGSFSLVALIAMLGCTVGVALRQLRVFPH